MLLHTNGELPDRSWELSGAGQRPPAPGEAAGLFGAVPGSAQPTAASGKRSAPQQRISAGPRRGRPRVPDPDNAPDHVPPRRRTAGISSARRRWRLPSPPATCARQTQIIHLNSPPAEMRCPRDITAFSNLTVTDLHPQKPHCISAQDRFLLFTRQNRKIQDAFDGVIQIVPGKVGPHEHPFGSDLHD